MELDIVKYDNDIKDMIDLKNNLIKARMDYIKLLEKDTIKNNELKYHIDILNKYKVNNNKLINILKNLKQYIKTNENNKYKEKNKPKKDNIKTKTQKKLAQVNIKNINKLIKQLNYK